MVFYLSNLGGLVIENISQIWSEDWAGNEGLFLTQIIRGLDWRVVLHRPSRWALGCDVTPWMTSVASQIGGRQSDLVSNQILHAHQWNSAYHRHSLLTTCLLRPTQYTGWQLDMLAESLHLHLPSELSAATVIMCAPKALQTLRHEFHWWACNIWLLTSPIVFLQFEKHRSSRVSRHTPGPILMVCEHHPSIQTLIICVRNNPHFRLNLQIRSLTDISIPSRPN